MRETSADTKVHGEGGGEGGGASGISTAVHLQPVVKTMVRQAVPLQIKEVHGGIDIHLQPLEDPRPE